MLYSQFSSKSKNLYISCKPMFMIGRPRSNHNVSPSHSQDVGWRGTEILIGWALHCLRLWAFWWSTQPPRGGTGLPQWATCAWGCASAAWQPSLWLRHWNWSAEDKCIPPGRQRQETGQPTEIMSKYVDMWKRINQCFYYQYLTLMCRYYTTFSFSLCSRFNLSLGFIQHSNSDKLVFVLRFNDPTTLDIPTGKLILPSRIFYHRFKKLNQNVIINIHNLKTRWNSVHLQKGRHSVNVGLHRGFVT